MSARSNSKNSSRAGSMPQLEVDPSLVDALVSAASGVRLISSDPAEWIAPGPAMS